MGDKTECEVLCEPFDLTSHKRIDCGWCDYVACSSCVQRHLLLELNEPCCMACKHEWNREFLNSKLPKKFITGPLKTHRENIIYEREKALLPETQPFAEIVKRVDRLKEKRLKIKDQLEKLQKEHHARPAPRYGEEYFKWQRDYNIANITLTEKFKYLDKLIIYLEGTVFHNAGRAQTVEERRTFVKPCPSPDCRGFLSTQWKCGLCSVHVCSKCHEIKNETEGQEHECNPETLASIQALERDSKPCPKCGAMIFRIEGCSQMFHTPLSGGCGAVFDWNTLRIYTGNENAVHNPHWYEYQRTLNNGNVPRQLGDVACGGVPTAYELSNTIYRFMPRTSKEAQTASGRLYTIHQGYNHNQHVELPRYAVNMIQDNRDLRISYLLSKIDQDKFKSDLQKRDKARAKKQHIGDILRTFQLALGDIMLRITRSETINDYTAILREIPTLIEFTNNAFKEMARIYDCVCPYIRSDTYKMDTIKKPKPQKKSLTNPDNEEPE